MDDHVVETAAGGSQSPPPQTYSEALDTVFAAAELAEFLDPKVNDAIVVGTGLRKVFTNAHESSELPRSTDPHGAASPGVRVNSRSAAKFSSLLPADSIPVAERSRRSGLSL